jgi:hypothetical protein
MSAFGPLLQASGREAAALGDQRVILGISLRSVSLESRIRYFLISLLARPDRIGLSFSAPLRYIDTIDARDKSDRRGFRARKPALWRRARGNDRCLVAQFRASCARSGEGQEKAGNHATRWLRASDSKFDAHHDAELIVGTIRCSASVTPESGLKR